MSADTRPITAERFAAALKELPLAALRLKLLEIRTSIAHLEYSNVQMRPFAEGLATPLAVQPSFVSLQQERQQSRGEREGVHARQGGDQVPSQPQPQRTPDQDCIDAIRENEGVIAQMHRRVDLIRAEVEGRGTSWAEFGDDVGRRRRRSVAGGGGGQGEGEEGGGGDGAVPLRNGHGHGHAETNGGMAAAAAAADRHPAWTDGTFTTGVIRNGELHLDEPTTQNAMRARAHAQQQQQQRGGSASEERTGGGIEADDEEGVHL